MYVRQVECFPEHEFEIGRCPCLHVHAGELRCMPVSVFREQSLRLSFPSDLWPQSTASLCWVWEIRFPDVWLGRFLPGARKFARARREGSLSMSSL